MNSVTALTKVLERYKKECDSINISSPGKIAKRELTINYLKHYKRVDRKGLPQIVFLYKVSGSRYLMKRYKELKGDNLIEDIDGNLLFFYGNCLIPSRTTLIIRNIYNAPHITVKGE